MTTDELRKRHNTTTTTTTTTNNNSIIIDAAAAEKEETSNDKTTTTKNKKKSSSVQEMLIHGSPESRGRKKTWFDVVMPAVVMACVFALSLFIFHIAPHEKSSIPKNQFKNMMAKHMMHSQQQQQKKSGN
eukprot:CAMPEP_0118697446 /NCGR_PEP_ID=MMETSP0800-20121206/14510_1 /TAXON_ID=210618 ORGANISM="Striatella unipunctata, Strain CCMP2910" /NCGR_SAMPLE_ID=MMETSP0800 /ASSEMBLY_ACC=CAM_ASM_000638 /LENGTH=129 /DNA_ID=CAMNT_0006596877 /DNA_START=1 /DNA_END=391 /DNA_ORIENTATION=-